MTVSNTLLIKVLLAAVSCVMAFVLFRGATDIDIKPWLAAGWTAFALAAIILP